MIQKSVTLTLLLLCGAGALTLEPPPITTGAINCVSQGQLSGLGTYIQGTAVDYITFKDTAVAQAIAILDKAEAATATFQNPELREELAADIVAGRAYLLALSAGSTAGINELSAEALLKIAEVKANALCTLDNPSFDFTDAFDYSGQAQLNINNFCAPLTLTSVTAKLGNQSSCDCGDL